MHNQKIQITQRKYSIDDITRLLQSKELKIQPKYQRRRTPWPLNAKTALIDTILYNFPIPPVYLRDYVDDQGKRVKEIIDGQQRISTIIEFYNNKFKLSKVISDDDLIGYYFSDLSNELKMFFQDYEIAFISIKGVSDSDVISIFSRLNSFSLPLNPQEKRNAKFPGEIKTTIYDLALKYNSFWQRNRILNPNQISRMGDALLVSEILYSLIYGIKSIRSKDLDNMYKDHDEEFKKSKLIRENFKKTIEYIEILMRNTSIASVFKSKYMFCSLFLALYDYSFGIKPKKKKLDINTNITEYKIEEFSIRFSEERFRADKLYMLKQATNNANHRKFRHKTLIKLIT